MRSVAGSSRAAQAAGLGDWFVTNGSRTIGPVSTHLVLRAAAEGVLPDRVLAWREPWPEWRSLESTREVQMLRRTQEMLGKSWVPPRAWEPESSAPTRSLVARWLEDAGDEQELLAMTMQGLALELRATVGMVHRPEGALGRLTTRSVVGAASLDRLGDVVRANDAAVRVARMGVTVLGDPSDSRAGIAAAVRLGDGCDAVALAPVYKGAKLAAVIELGKVGKRFRRTDRALIKSYTRLASERLSM